MKPDRPVSSMKHLSCDLRHVVLAVASLIMLANTFTHPVTQNYDYKVHQETIRANISLRQYMLPGAGQLEYNPPLYYMIYGKASRLVQLVVRRELDPFYIFRLLHLVAIVGIGWLYLFRLIPRLTQSRFLVQWAALAFFVVPNVFLSQVMVRADHLLFLFIHLLFFLWFYYEFPQKLAQSTWRQCAWVLSLVGMANARSLSLAAFGVFFVWGLIVLVRERKAVRVAALALVTLIGSGYFYFTRYQRTGLIFAVRTDLPYYESYYQKQIGWSRTPMFLNLEFYKLLDAPNRNANFTGQNAFLPRLYGDMWADHWLYFSGPTHVDEETRPKKIVLIVGSLFSIGYFVSLFYYAVRGIGATLRKEELRAAETAGLLFAGALILLVVYVYREPEVDKNSTVKFAYLLGYQWFPIFCMLDFMNKHRALIKPVLIYSALLFLLALPLYVFAW
jgi:hypothetical protein